MQAVGEECAKVAQRRGHLVLTAQHVAATRGDDVQPIAGMANHFLHPAPVENLQALAELLTDGIGGRALLAGLEFVMLVDVIGFEALECGRRVVQAGRGHAPRAYGRTHQVHRMAALRQPVTKDKAVQSAKDQALGPACRPGYDGNVCRLEAVLLDMPACLGTGVNAEGLHGGMIAIVLIAGCARQSSARARFNLKNGSIHAFLATWRRARCYFFSAAITEHFEGEDDGF